MKFYALKKKNARAYFICPALTEAAFKESVNKAFWNSYGMRPRGTALYILDDFLADYDQVIVTIEGVNVL